MQTWIQSLLAVIAILGVPILLILVFIPGLTYAHHHSGGQVPALYRQGEIDGNALRQNGGSTTYESCIENFQATYGLDTAEYCNGYFTGFLDGVIN